MPKMYSYIFCDNALEQAEFYANALNGEILSVQKFDEMPNADEKAKGRIMHLVLQVGENQIFMADLLMENIKPGNQIDLGLTYQSEEEAGKVFANLSEGGNVVMPFEKTFWGATFGRVIDKYGVHWQVVTEH
jgi:PhnB protein